MPFSTRSYLRKVPLDLLRQHLDARSIRPSVDLDWSVPRSSLIDQLLLGLGSVETAGFDADVERIMHMSDDVGQAALMSVSEQHRAELDALTGSVARSTWLLLNQRRDFGRAEDVRFTDGSRKSRMWDGFRLPPNLDFVGDQSAIDRFKDELRAVFQSPHVELDIFKRQRKTANGEEIDLIQLTAYREGQVEEQLEFQEGVLGHRSYRPVHEAAMTYEPKTGSLEVIVLQSEDRAAFAQLCCEHLLHHPADEKLPLRQFDLAVLMKPQPFNTAASDRIESVTVDMLRLMPIDTGSERLVLQTVGRDRGNVWSMAERRFGANNPLSEGWLPTQARLVIKFHREPGRGRGRTLPVTITMPHGCDLKERTDRERLIAGRYLEEWGLLRSA